MIISTTISGRNEATPFQATAHLTSGTNDGDTVSRGDGLAGKETARAREVREGKNSDLPQLLSGLETAYTGENGPPGKGKNAAKNAEAQQQITENAQDGEKALQGAGQNVAELRHLDSQAQKIKSVPDAGPKGEMAPEVNTEVAQRSEEQPQPRSARLPQQLQEQGVGRQTFPAPEKGDTRDRLQVEAGPSGRETLRSELDAQRRQEQQQTQSQEDSTRVKSDLGRQSSEIERAKQSNGQELQEQNHELQKGQQNLASDQQTSERSQRGVQEARTRVGKDQAQVQQDQTIVDQDQSHVSEAQTSVAEARTEVGKADEMSQQADQRLQRAQQLKPGNGQGGGGGQSQGGGAAQAKGKEAGKGGGGGPNGQGNGNGVVWKKALASAQDFRQKAAKRKTSSVQRQQTAQHNVETARTKLQRDREGLAQSQGHLTRSQANLGVRNSDLQIAQTNLRNTQSAVSVLQKNLENLGIRGKALEARESGHRESLRLFDINHEFLRGNTEKGGRNIALLERELEKQPLAREVILEELKEASASAAGSRPAAGSA